MNKHDLQNIIDTCRKSGQKTAVSFCSHVPAEILEAAGICHLRIPHIQNVRDAASRILPGNVCPIVKNCCDICEDECLENADLILAETSCDGKRKMYELISRQDRVYFYQVAQGADRDYVKPLIQSECRYLVKELNKRFGLDISEEQNKPDIKQFRMDVAQSEKADAIARILDETGFDRCMAFCNTKGSTERITKFLQMRGIDAECIHGDIPQRRREQVMDLFRKGKLRVFVSTDVAARGIDVDDVDIVFNCDVPDENQDYVHRIGRTGRAKRQGVAVSLIADYPSKMRIDDIAQKTRNEIVQVKFGEDGKLTVIE